jgi:hypothetical protein
MNYVQAASGCLQERGKVTIFSGIPLFMKSLLLRRTLYLLACATFAACNALSKHNYIPLTASAIYDLDSVRRALDGGDEKAADKKLAEAIDTYKQKKDTLGSVPLFKDAILLKPTAKGYFGLSGALLASRQYDAAIKALNIAEKLNYAPLANVMFRYSYAYANMITDQNGEECTKSAIYYMQLALQMGYAHPEEFLRKEYFPKLPPGSDFTETFNKALSGMAGRNPEKSLWESYAGQFPEVSLPLIINLPWIRAHKLEDMISFEFERFIPDMRNSKFAREGGDVFYYIALVRKDPAYTAVVYAMQYEGEEEDDTPDSAQAGAVTTLTPTFYLTTYDPHGKIIDGMMVAGRNDLQQPFMAFAMQSNMHFQIQDFTDDYKEDPEKGGRDSSSYLGLKAQTPENFLIDATGKIIKTDAPLAAR